MQTIKAILYARVSTVDKGQNPERQLHEMYQFANARGWETVTALDYMSATKDRPGLQELWRLCRQRQVDIVLVHEFSRFARSTRELVLALEEFHALGIQFVSLKEQIDTTTPAGRLVYTVIAAIAEFERSMIRQRVVSGLALRRDKGYKLGRPCVGLDTAYIARLREEGASWRKIGMMLRVSGDTCQRALKRATAELPASTANQSAGSDAKTPEKVEF